MGKISQVSAKYIVHAYIQIEGVVEKPDVIGAIFGQTEGLLGSDLELRELQRSGRIGRIEVNTVSKAGKTQGEILIPSSLDKAETAIIAAALEVIERIGPCNSSVEVKDIEDVRISKRKYVIDRAKALLRDLIETQLPDTLEMTDEVSYSVRMMEITDYGPEKLAAGPTVDDSDEIIVVEGRADVLNLLKHGFKNAVCLNGTNIPKTIIKLCEQKTVTVFVDGDRGGDLILKGLLSVAEVDFIAKAPDGKEVEEITKKEIHKALRSKINSEQIRMEIFDDQELEEIKQKFEEKRKELYHANHSINENKNFSNKNNSNFKNQNHEKKNESDVERNQNIQNGNLQNNTQKNFSKQNPNNRKEEKKDFDKKENIQKVDLRNEPKNDLRNKKVEDKVVKKDINDNKKIIDKKPKKEEVEEIVIDKESLKRIKYLLEEIIGTNGVYLLDKTSTILSKVPLKELSHTLSAMSNGVFMLVVDGILEQDVIDLSLKYNVKKIICMDSRVNEVKGLEIIKMDDIE
ncbi:MAG: DNA primase DnaG [Candidatus Nanoarchaeia archaeon]|nr:DNA primase DnaG [Candidatus Nanoarchaeia archaeon]